MLNDRWCCSTLRASTAHLSSCGSGAEYRSLRIAAGEYDGIWTGVDHRDDSRHGAGPERRGPSWRNRHRNQHRHQSRADHGHRRPRPVSVRRPVPRHLRPEGRALRLQDLRAEGLCAQPERQPRHRRAAGNRPADRDGHGHQPARSDPDGNRRARRRADRQADRQPVGHRPQRARTDAHPARRRHRVQPGRVGRLRRRRQQHAGLHRQRHPLVGQHGLARRLVAHRHRQQRRRHRLAEQRHGSGSEGPELELRGRIRHRRHERQRRHQVRQLEVPRLGSTTTGATTSSPPTTARTASPARRSRRAPISIRAATSAARSCSATATRRTATGCSSSSPTRAQRQQVDSGSHFTRTYSPGDAQRRLQRAARQPRLEPEQHPAAAHSAGRSRTPAQPAPNNNMAPVHHADRHGTSPACIRCRTTTTRTTSTTTSTARSSRTTASTSSRASTGTSATAPRPTSASRSEGETADQPARRVVGARRRRRAADAEHRREPRPLLSPATSCRSSARR